MDFSAIYQQDYEHNSMRDQSIVTSIATKMLTLMITIADTSKDIVVSTFREGDPKGVVPRAFYKKMGFVEDELIEEFGYPNQKFILHS